MGDKKWSTNADILSVGLSLAETIGLSGTGWCSCEFSVRDTVGVCVVPQLQGTGLPFL